jgi:hypothetical protein
VSSAFGPSRLARQLGAWVDAPAAPAGADFAERLAQSLHVVEAIQLQAALQGLRATDAAEPASPPGRGRAPRGADLAADLQRVRDALLAAIARDPLPAGGAGADDATDGPWRQRHQALQRQMEQMVGALRGHVRAALARGTPHQRRLALLDELLEQLLAPREQAALPAAVAVLARRHAQLKQAHRAARQAADAPDDDPAAWRAPGGWLHTYAQDWRAALAAELDLRLDPVAGLIASLAAPATTAPTDTTTA